LKANKNKLKSNFMKKFQTLVGICVVLFCGSMLLASQSQETWLDKMSVSDGSKALTEKGYEKPDPNMTEAQHVQWAKKQIDWASGSGY
jgi:hypothetical protein